MPDYQIHKVSTCVPKDGEFYFFDANVWIYILDQSSEPSHKAYIDFFGKVISQIEDYESRKKQYLEDGRKIKPGVFDDSQKPIIILTPLLISEMFNVLIYSRFREWKEMTKNHSAEFKKDFRGTQEHIDAVKLLKTDLFNYEQYFKIIDDCADDIGVRQIFDDQNYNMDFNDQCYYYICFENKFILVTNDGDFMVEYIPIYTELPYLLRASTI